MHPVVKGSLVLAGLVGLFSALFYAFGLHESYVVGQTVFLAVAIGLNVAVVIWVLGQTAAHDGYGKQVANAAGIGVLGGLLVTLVSWFLLALVFPDALDELRAGAVAYMEQAGTPPAEFEQQREMLEAATPFSQSLPGGIGTFFTSLLTGAVFAVWRRRA